MAYSETKFAKSASDFGTFTLLGIGMAGCLLISYQILYEPIFNPSTPPLSSTVKVELAIGHGSGIHIGGGLILTAAHVASEGDVVKLKTEDGMERDAAVLWASKASDVALLRTSPDGLGYSPLSCAPPVVGQAVTTHGSPLDVEFISTYGHIVSAAQPMGDWSSVVVVDMEIIPGMSGGGVLDDAGEVVGIAVGLATLPLGFSVSATGIGMVVPSSVVCGLMGR